MHIFAIAFVVLVSAQSYQPFDTILGSNHGVIGYSNGDSSYVDGSANFVGDVYSGVQWQCVEYARRWLITAKGLTFDSVNCASDIWHLNNLEFSKSTSMIRHFSRVPNGSKCSPKEGNILIYARSNNNDMTYGHVAVITRVTKDTVYVSEQNFDNDYWPKDYARKLVLTTQNGLYTIQDDYDILGWMVYETYDTSCYDLKCNSCSSPNENDPNNPCSYN